MGLTGVFSSQGTVGGVAVDGAAGGGEDEFVHALGGGDGQQVDGAEDVGPGVGQGVHGGLADAGLGGEVEDDFGPFPPDDLGDAGVVEAGVVEGGGVVEAAEVAGGEVVDDRDGVVVLQQGRDQMGADEAGAAGDQGFDGFRQGKNSA